MHREMSPSPGTPMFGVSCSFFYPVQVPLGIKLTAQTTHEDTRETVCGVAERYLGGVLPIWKTPPLVSAGATTPRISLYGKDPCAALLPATGTRAQSPSGAPRYLSGLQPYAYEFAAADGEFDPISVEFASLFDESGPTVALGDRTAFVDQSGGACEYRVAVDPPIRFKVGDPEWPGYEPGLIISLDTCDTGLATSIARAALDRPVPPAAVPRPGAPPMRLGVLTGA